MNLSDVGFLRVVQQSELKRYVLSYAILNFPMI